MFLGSRLVVAHIIMNSIEYKTENRVLWMKFVWIFTCVYCVNANKWKHFNLIYTSRSLSWNQSIRGVMTEVLFSSSFCSRLISLFDWCFLISSQHPLVSNMYSVRVFPSMGKSFGHFYYISAENFLSREFNLIDVETIYWSSVKDLLLEEAHQCSRQISSQMNTLSFCMLCCGWFHLAETGCVAALMASTSTQNIFSIEMGKISDQLSSSKATIEKLRRFSI